MDTTKEVACPVGAASAPTTPKAPGAAGRQPDAPQALTLLGICRLLDARGALARGIEAARDVRVTGAACDSRFVREGDLFFCKGRAFKPAYLASAAERGAVAYACEPDAAPALAKVAPGLPAMLVSDMRVAMAVASAAAFGHPDRSLPMVGITGTKGKSTSAYMLRSIVDAAEGERRCGVMGSIDTYDGVEDAESTNTTPEAPDLWRHLANARESGLAAMVMEVSSQALKYDRSLDVELDVACFLNIGTDHISPVEHPTFEDYFSSKLRIFRQGRVAVVNLGTAHLERVLSAASSAEGPDGERPRLVTVSAAGPEPVECGSCDMVFPDVWATDVRPEGSRVSFVAHGCGLAPVASARAHGLAAEAPASGAGASDAGDEAWSLPVTLNFPGLFNVENALVAIACAELLGIDRAHVATGLAACRVPGRMELVGKPGSRVLCVVDYAHNALSYQRFFASMAKEFPGRRIVALIGAPGGKAYERREELPREAARWASHIVATEEDPAHDSNEDICREMDANVPEGATLADGTPVTHEYVLDRQQAVARCLDVALGYGEPALVCLLGKGDETLIHRGDRFEPMVPDAEAFRQAAAARGVEL